MSHELKLKSRRLINGLAVVNLLALAGIFLAGAHGAKPIVVLLVLILLGLMIWNIAYSRCPHCDRFLRSRSGADYCPYCGKRAFD